MTYVVVTTLEQASGGGGMDLEPRGVSLGHGVLRDLLVLVPARRAGASRRRIS